MISIVSDFSVYWFSGNLSSLEEKHPFGMPLKYPDHRERIIWVLNSLGTGLISVSKTEI